MYVLGLDIETTGLDFDECKIIEIGAVVWHTETNKPVAMLNHLIAIGEETLTDNIINLTGITDQDLTDFGINEKQALTDLLSLAKKCAYIVAHNGNSFDKIFIDKALDRHDLVLDKPWIDTMYDVPYPSHIKTRKLTYLAAEHQYLNANAHRALFDVLSMMHVASQYSWQEIISLFQSPLVDVQALVSYDEKNKAKLAGFRWNAEKKVWFKTMKQQVLEQAEYDFEYKILTV